MEAPSKTLEKTIQLLEMELQSCGFFEFKRKKYLKKEIKYYEKIYYH